ncbi:MAG: MBL fold metallo-hydrolase [Pseudomonadota bacterium]|nr:MBL fold metallo-hydrolase [Pseudomonadota bacterium]
MHIRYVAEHGVYIAKNAGNGPGASGNVPKLLGARVHVDLAGVVNGWVPVTDVPDEQARVHSGFVELDRLSPTQQLKIFYVDVGQGDATLIEGEGAVVIVDGGPNSGFHKYLQKRLKALRRADAAIGMPEREHLFIDAVFVSHFDQDHYQGLVAVLKDPGFRIGTLYHNGLPRYGESAGKDLDLGTIVEHQDGTRSISTDLSGIASARTHLGSDDFKAASGRPNNFRKFLDALVTAHDAGRLNSVRRLVARDPASVPDVVAVGADLRFQVLGPLTTRQTGAVRLPCFPDPHKVTPTNPRPAPSESHTINGNSIVLRLVYRNVRFLFGGDLNQPAQRYLHERYGNSGRFRVDVNKACHHGSSDFDVVFIKDISTSATVFSSGDNGSYDHPLPDAIGAAARHSDGEVPLVFSTELARDNLAGGKIRFGHINARSNGDTLVMAQKKERPGRSTNPWHTFPVPYPGPFSHG